MTAESGPPSAFGAQCKHSRSRAANEKISVTVSIGVAEFVLESSAETFIECADRAMYRAKQAGRNRVERVHPHVPSSETSAIEAAILS